MRTSATPTAEQMLGAAVVALPLAAVMIAAGHSHVAHADAGHLLVTMTVALLSSVVPFVLYNIAIGGVTATSAALVLTLVPLFGALASVVLLGEHLAAAQLAGGAFVVVAAGLATIGVDAERAIPA